jgi:hypothetical protein
MVFTDPPWNIPIAGHVSGLGAIKHGDFAMGCGEMSARGIRGLPALSKKSKPSYRRRGMTTIRYPTPPDRSNFARGCSN